MMGMAGCRDIRHALGAYVLGAIDGAERATVDGHLATCADCREELAGLAALPALLRRVPVSEAERLAARDWDGDALDEAPPDELLTSLLLRTAQTRRAGRRRSLAAASAVVVMMALAAGAGGAAVAHGLAAGTPAASATLDSWQTAAGSSAGSGVAMTVRYARTAWGTTMAVRVTGLPAGTACQFQVTDSAGRTRVLGRWHVGYGGAAAWYPVSTSVPVSGLRSFQIASGGTVVDTVRPLSAG